MASVRIDFNVDDSEKSVVAFLRRARTAFDGTANEVHMDFSPCGYIGPYAASLLLSIVRENHRVHRITDVVLPERPPEVAAFCHFVGLKHLLHGAPAPDSSAPGNETLPLQENRDATFWVPQSLVGLVRRHVSLSEDQEDLLSVCFSEVQQNVKDHASSPVGSITCARVFVNRREIRIAIVDRGCGIGNSLRRTYPKMDDPSALHAVLMGGHSSRSRRGNRGLGIQTLAQVVAGTGGDVMIVSGSSYAVIRKDQPHARTLPDGLEFPGTAVFFRFCIAAESVGR